MVGLMTFRKSHLPELLAHTEVTFPIAIAEDVGPAEFYANTHEGITWFPFHVLLNGKGEIHSISTTFDLERTRRQVNALIAAERVAE